MKYAFGVKRSVPGNIMARAIRATFSSAALLAGAAGVQPTLAADVVPIAGLVVSFTDASTFGGVGRESANDTNRDAWLALPVDLTASSAATLFPGAGGLIGSSQTIDATWANSGLSGTISAVNQELIVRPDDTDLSYYALSNNQSAEVVLGDFASPIWSYQFHANTDSMFTLSYRLVKSTSSTADDYGSARVPYQNALIINGSSVMGQFEGLDGFEGNFNTDYTAKFTYMLTAGQDYLVDLNFFNQDQLEGGGTSVINVSKTATWSITDRPADSGDGDGGMGGGDTGAVPELATWTMMVAGFGLVGGTLRRRATTLRSVFA